MQHQEFSNFVDDSWLRTNVFRQKIRLLARVGGIQKARCHNDNAFLTNLECDLVKQCEVIRENEAML